MMKMHHHFFTSFFLKDLGLSNALVNILKGSCLGCCFSTKYFFTTPFKKISASRLFPILTVSYFILLLRVHRF